MNHDEIQLMADIRPDAPPYEQEAKAAARRGLVAAARPKTVKAIWRRPYSMVLAGALAVAVGATAVTLAQAPGAGPSGKAEEVVVTMPKIVNMSASEVLDRAAKAASRTDLTPRDDQFVKVESQTMYGSFGGGAVNGETGENSEQTRYLYRTKRVIWQSADGTRDGALTIEYLKPKAYPGWPIPEQAYEDTGTAELPLPTCGTKIPGYMRTDYASLKNLPSDADGMRAHLYTGDRGGNSKDEAAFTAAGDMLRETYMPPAQRAALFKAVGTIPGVGVIETAEDAAGRKGIGVGRAGLDGVRQDLIFDPKSYELLGERGIVVDESAAKSPVGSLVASTAQLSVTVADKAPAFKDKDGTTSSCG
jgi:hypothetical protein